MFNLHALGDEGKPNLVMRGVQRIVWAGHGGILELPRPVVVPRSPLHIYIYISMSLLRSCSGPVEHIFHKGSQKREHHEVWRTTCLS